MVGAEVADPGDRTNPRPCGLRTPHTYRSTGTGRSSRTSSRPGRRIYRIGAFPRNAPFWQQGDGDPIAMSGFLDREDADVTEALQMLLEEEGIDFVLNARINRRAGTGKADLVANEMAHGPWTAQKVLARGGRVIDLAWVRRSAE